MLHHIAIMLILLVIGYVFGCFSTGYFVGKMYGIDIRSSGSGNIGTTNALRTLGPKAGLFTFLGDLLKALIPTLIVRIFLFQDNAELNYLFVLTIGLGVVMGHNFPFYLHFKGGKGIAVTAGVIIATTNWLVIVTGLLVFIIVVALTRYVSVGSLIIVWLVPIFTLYHYHASEYFVEMIVISVIFTGLAYFKHRTNIKRLFSGTENKLNFSNKKENEE